MSNTILLPLVHVLVERSNDMKLNARVPEHEIAVLQACHGRSKIHRQPAEEYPEEVAFDINADAEFQRLVRKYQRKNETDPARLAFPTGPRELVAFGFELGRGEAQEAPASVQIDYAKERRKAEAEKKKAEAKGKAKE